MASGANVSTSPATSASMCMVPPHSHCREAILPRADGDGEALATEAC